MSALSLWRVIGFACLLSAAAAIGSPAQTFTRLYSFCSQTGCTDGSQPLSGLVQATDGNFYGTNLNAGSYLDGTVFKITPDGMLTTLYSLCAKTGCADGNGPIGALTHGTDANLYGTTCCGGTSRYGVVFKITTGGALTTLYSFCSKTGCSDGSVPQGALLEGNNGNLYGTTSVGGANGSGTVFKVSPAGTLTTLYTFCSQTGCPDGANPYTGLVQATDGNFYGTTCLGGAKNGGTVFKITPGGTLTTLYSFCSQTGCTDGSYPYSGLIQATDGSFYGTTEYNGASGHGTVFKITAAGKLTTLHSFNGTDGANPDVRVMQGSDGNFYGTTRVGGANNAGTVFEITPGGTLTTLYSFCSQSGCTDGSLPQGALLEGTDGNLYGTTTYGGAYTTGCTQWTKNGCGTVFRLSVGLGAFVETDPASGTVGQHVLILGNNLTGSTSVTFNGTPASFTVVSDSYIKATVPSGATTGSVQVLAPSGTLTSKGRFQVR